MKDTLENRCRKARIFEKREPAGRGQKSSSKIGNYLTLIFPLSFFCPPRFKQRTVSTFLKVIRLEKPRKRRFSRGEEWHFDRENWTTILHFFINPFRQLGPKDLVRRMTIGIFSASPELSSTLPVSFQLQIFHFKAWTRFKFPILK